MSKRRSNQLPTNLPQLQNLIKRDPGSYKEEFLLQHHHFKALLQLVLFNPSQVTKNFQELVMFLSQVCSCYPDEMKQFPDELQSLLQQHSSVLHPELRLTLCRALILIRNKGVIPPDSLLELFFKLLQCPDKLLRMTLYSHIVSDIKRINAKRKNNQVNLRLQNFMYQMLKDTSRKAVKMSLDVLIELYHRNIWNDAKTVNVISTACFSSFAKVLVAAVRFFLTDTEDGHDGDSSSDSEEEEESIRRLVIAKQANKRGRKREKRMEKAVAALKKHRSKQRVKSSGNFSALYLINDPQDFAERLFHRLEQSRERYEVKMLLLALVSRLIGVHQLILFNYYPYLQRYLQPHQKDVTKILTFLAQASHEMVPPEILEPALRCVVNNFVSERNTTEAMAVGLNTVRELCSRCPLVMSQDLLQDLTAYKSYRDKSVAMAARSLVQLFRTINPTLLSRKDKGRPTAAATPTIREYGQSSALDHVPGTELVDLPSDEPDDDEEEDIEEDMVEEQEYSNEEDSSCEESEEEYAEEDCDVEENGDSDIEDEAEEMEDEEGSNAEEESFCIDREGGPISTNQQYTVTAKPPSTVTRMKKTPSAAGHRKEELEKMSSREVVEESRRVRKERAAVIGQTRFLTQKEFQQIKLEQLMAASSPAVGKKRTAEELMAAEEDQHNSELLSPSAIESLAKRKRMDREARLASVQAGREGRKQYGFKKRKMSMFSSSTNREKDRNKNFLMVRQKRGLRGKKKRSFRDKQLSLKKSLLKKSRRK